MFNYLQETNHYSVHPFHTCLENDGNSHGVLLLNSNAMGKSSTARIGNKLSALNQYAMILNFVRRFFKCCLFFPTFINKQCCLKKTKKPQSISYPNVKYPTKQSGQRQKFSVQFCFLKASMKRLKSNKNLNFYQKEYETVS